MSNLCKKNDLGSSQPSYFVARFSVTARCNLSCSFCDGSLGNSRDLTYDETVRILRACRDGGLSVVHWTGGEPTMREDLRELVSCAKRMGFRYQKLTTNGVLLREVAEGLSRNGLDRVNVSVPSISRTEYETVTRRDALPLVLEGIEESSKHFELVKINICLTKEAFEAIPELVEYAKSQNGKVVLKFIELVPCYNKYEDSRDLFESEFISIDMALDRLREMYDFQRIKLGCYSRQKCKYYKITENGVVVGMNPNRSISYACQRKLCRDLRIAPNGVICDCSVNLTHRQSLLELSDEQAREVVRDLVSIKARRTRMDWERYVHHQKHYSFWRFGIGRGTSG